MAGTNGRVRAPSELVVAALVAAASLPLARLFRTGGIIPTIIVSIVASGALAWVLRRARVMALLAALIAAAAWFWFAGLIFYRGELFLGILPEPGTITAILRAIGSGIKTSSVEVAPVPAIKELLVIVSAVVWGATWLVDDAVHKLRHPLLAIGFVLPMFVFPGTLVDSPHRWLDASLFIAASLAILFVDETSRLSRWGRTAGGGSAGWKPGLALRIGSLVTVGAIALAPLIPGYAGTGDAEGSGPGSGDFAQGDRVALNPLVSIQPRLRRSPPTLLFTVEADTPAYWRITALDLFNGFTWTAPRRDANAPISGRTVKQSQPGTTTRAVRQKIRLGGLAGPWLPAAYEPVRVDRAKNIALEEISRSLVSPGRLRPGQRYEVTSRLPAPTPLELDQVTQRAIDGDPAMAPYLAFPRVSSSSVVEDLTQRIIKGKATPYRRALALQTFLRSPAFTYNENVADGHSYNTLESFLLEVREGYCEQFSAAMAVMARMAGIPSRVAIGFAVGTRKNGIYEVTSKAAHSWVELYFPGHGWLQFEPTPRSDGATVVPPYAQPGSLDPSPSVEPTTNTSVRPSASPTASPTGRAPAEGDETGGTTVARPGRSLKPILIPIAILALAALAVPAGAEAKRRLRRTRAADPRSLAVTYYMDFLDWCAAAGFPKRAGETPAEYASRLTELAAGAEGSLQNLADTTASLLWAPLPEGAGESGGTAGIEATSRLGREARTALAATLPVKARVLSAVGWGWWKR